MAPATSRRGSSPAGLLGACWGVAGVLLLLSSAVYRLGLQAEVAVRSPLDGVQWTALVLFAAFMAYSEGYRGFQKAFAPRFAARARYLREHPRPLRVALAPLFCMGFFHTTPRRQRVTVILTTAIVGFILLIKLTPQPWRGIIDAGVVVGLGYGVVSVLVFTTRTFAAERSPYDPEVPDVG